MSNREPAGDNPWALAALVALGLACAVFGLCVWMQILDGAAR